MSSSSSLWLCGILISERYIADIRDISNKKICNGCIYVNIEKYVWHKRNVFLDVFLPVDKKSGSKNASVGCFYDSKFHFAVKY